MNFSGAIIQPRKAPHEREVTPVVVMAFIRSDMKLLEQAFHRVHKVQKLEEGRIVQGVSPHGISLCVAGPVLGAPHAVILLEKLIVLGARYLYCLGWCGSLSPQVCIGDFVVPLSALSEEGTSRHYPLRGKKVTSSPLLTRHLVEALQHKGCSFHQGRIWTTDAVYRETVQKVRDYRQKGLLAVEMEMSALFKVALFRKVELASLLLVSDELGSLKWRPGFGAPRFHQSRTMAVQVLLEASRSIHEELSG